MILTYMYQTMHGGIVIVVMGSFVQKADTQTILLRTLSHYVRLHMTFRHLVRMLSSADIQPAVLYGA